MAEPKSPNSARAPWTVIDLFHKERGGKGVWKGIAQGSQVRVTKNIGKRIKVVVKSSVKFTRTDLTLRLVDLSAGGPEKDGQFSFESSSLKDNEWGGETADMELKVYTLAKKLMFHSNIQTENGTLVCRSVWFGTHNSGKQRKKRKGSDEESPVKRQKLTDEDDYSGDYSDDEGRGRSQGGHSAIVLPSFQHKSAKHPGGGSYRPPGMPEHHMGFSRSPPGRGSMPPNQYYPQSSPHDQPMPHRGPPPSNGSRGMPPGGPGQHGYQSTLFFGKYPDYRNHLSLSHLADLLDLVTQSPSTQIEWYQGTPPSTNRAACIVIEETMQLFGCVTPSMNPNGVILSIRHSSLIPVIAAAILQFATAASPQLLSAIANNRWTFPNPLLQKEIEILRDEAQRILDSQSPHHPPPASHLQHSLGPPPPPSSIKEETISETKTQTITVGSQYVNVETTMKWSQNCGISFSELDRLNSWTNEGLVTLGVTSPKKPKFIFALLSCSHQNENLTLAIYRFDKLLHCENHHVNPRCSGLCLDEPDMKGVYTFVAFFNRPIREFPFSGFISLHDFRGPTVRQTLLPCTPSEINNFPHIWIVGHLTVEGNYYGFGCKMNDQTEVGPARSNSQMNEFPEPIPDRTSSLTPVFKQETYPLHDNPIFK